MICQEGIEEPLTYPSKYKRKDVCSGYSSLADNLIIFNQPGQLPFHLAKRLDEGNGIESGLTYTQDLVLDGKRLLLFVVVEKFSHPNIKEKAIWLHEIKKWACQASSKACKRRLAYSVTV